MNERITRKVLLGLAAVTIAGIAQPAFAEESKESEQVPTLQQQQPNLDNRKIEQPTPVLNGQITKLDNAAQATQDGNTLAPTMDVDQALKTFLNAARAMDTNDLNKASRMHGFRFVVKSSGMSFFDLRSQRPKLSADDFRKMEYGVIGLDAVVHFDGSGPLVRDVYPTCPAANAGIRAGDLIVKANDYTLKPGDGQRVLWQVVAGKAGTPVDITVLREGELITFHLTRMNIEDIEDMPLRRTFENLLSQLGPPQQDP